VNCIQPGAASPEDLMACADGEASPAIVDHVQQCAACAEEVASYTQAQRRLRHTFYRMHCPSAEALGDYENGLTSAAERVELASHIRDCPRCTEDLQTLRAFLRSADDDAPAASVGILQRLVRVVASAVAPPLQPGTAGAALRGRSDDDSFTYRAGSQSIKISQTPEGRRRSVTLIGLVWDNDTPDADLDGEARLVSEGGIPAVSTIDSLGNFMFEGVSAGSYHLEIQTQQQIAVVENLRIGD
jgi:hypothetical protein